MQSHAANPIADHVHDDLFRIYFSTRDSDNRSSIGWVEIDIKHPSRVIRIAGQPVLEPGQKGYFDDSGVTCCCILRKGNTRWLYYLGWNLGVTVPWRNSIGLAISQDGERYERVSLAPIMDRCDVDPLSLSYCWVTEDNDIFRMWYGSNLAWGSQRTDFQYRIKCAYSRDRINWTRNGQTVIFPNDAEEYAFARPSVIRENDIFKMWYTYRGLSYRIGYAESRDGENWLRKDREVGIDVSIGEWDGEEIGYPCVFEHNGKKYMLYCGNGYGRTGFGLAVLERG